MTEKEALRDLAVRHYPGKWRKAQELARDERHHHELDYWHSVRVIFLELGGGYIQQLSFLERLTYLLPFDMARRA